MASIEIALPQELAEWMESVERKLDRIERNTLPKPKAPVIGKVLSAKAVAQMIGVTEQTVYKWAREEKLRSVHVGGRVLFPDSAIEEFLERRGV